MGGGLRGTFWLGWEGFGGSCLLTLRSFGGVCWELFAYSRLIWAFVSRPIVLYHLLLRGSVADLCTPYAYTNCPACLEILFQGL